MGFILDTLFGFLWEAVRDPDLPWWGRLLIGASPFALIGLFIALLMAA